MRQFFILMIFVMVFGGVAVMYEQDSRKVKGALAQVTDLQAKVGDLQAAINRLDAELAALKLAQRRKPNLHTMAHRARHTAKPAAAIKARGRKLNAADVTPTPPVISNRENSSEIW